MPKMALWDQINEDHWLRDYGKTQVIVIDDQWSSKDPFLFVPLMERKTIEKKLNIAFHFFKPPDGGEWNDKWFFGELEKAKENCPRPSVILLDLMYGSENSPIKGSGKRFLNSLSNVDFWRDVPVLIITAGEEDESLLQELKQVGGSFQDFLGKMYPKEEPFSERVERGLLEYGLLSDPNIHAYSFKMRKTAQEMRKVLLDEKLKEEIRIPGIQTVFETRPKSVLFVGNSGDGKNHLADYLQEMSDRREAPYEVMTFSDVSDPKDIEPTLFGSGPFTDFRGRTTRIDSQTGQRSTRGDIELAIVGLVTNLDKGTILLDELGNSSPDMQKKLLRFLDTRQIKPNLVSLPENTSYIPSRKPYDLWVIMTMQPSHAKKLKDLVRRRGKMVRIDIPSLNERREDVIPMAVAAVDKTKRPNVIFTEDAISWLLKTYSRLTSGNLTALISKLAMESSKYPFNDKELEQAFTKMLDEEDEEQQIAAKEQIPPHARSKAFSPQLVDTGFRENMLPSMVSEHNHKIVDYLIEALEKEKDPDTFTPNYPQTWRLMTKLKNKNLEDKTIGSTELQRIIGEYIFKLNDYEIIERMERSEVFRKTVDQCGRHIKNKEDQKRYSRIKQHFGDES